MCPTPSPAALWDHSNVQRYIPDVLYFTPGKINFIINDFFLLKMCFLFFLFRFHSIRFASLCSTYLCIWKFKHRDTIFFTYFLHNFFHFWWLLKQQRPQCSTNRCPIMFKTTSKCIKLKLLQYNQKILYRQVIDVIFALFGTKFSQFHEYLIILIEVTYRTSSVAPLRDTTLSMRSHVFLTQQKILRETNKRAAEEWPICCYTFSTEKSRHQTNKTWKRAFFYFNSIWK